MNRKEALEILMKTADELKSTIADGLLTKVTKEEYIDLVEAIEKLNEPITLADFLGWEEGAVYKVGELYYSIEGVNLYYFKDFDSPRIKTNQDIIIDLLELVNEAEKVEPKKYYLKHRFLGSEGVNYLNYRSDSGEFCLLGLSESYDYKTKFTDKEIEEIEASGFDLCNFEKVEVEYED